jgi:hypothetical protein
MRIIGPEEASANRQRDTIPYLVGTKTLSTPDGCLRKRAIEHIFSLLSFLVRQKAEARTILVETFVQLVLFVPAILVVIDIVVRLRISEVQLRKPVTQSAIHPT